MASTELNDLTAELQNYIVAPLNAFGLGGFVFDVAGEATTTLTAEITDHYTEDNKAVQDHIARKPKSIVLRGYVGELVYKQDDSSTSDILQNVVQKLTELSAFAPVVSTALSQAQDIATNGTTGFNEDLSDAADIYGLVQNVIGATGDMAQQQKAYLYFKACWEQGVLMGIQTPWEFLTNMAIESVVAIQTEASTTISDFSVKYKQMRFAKTTSQAYSPSAAAQADTAAANAGTIATPDAVGAVTSEQLPELQGDASLQAPDPVSIGPVPGVVMPSSILPGAQALITSAHSVISNSAISGIFIDGPAPPEQ